MEMIVVWYVFLTCDKDAAPGRGHSADRKKLNQNAELVEQAAQSGLGGRTVAEPVTARLLPCLYTRRCVPSVGISSYAWKLRRCRWRRN